MLSLPFRGVVSHKSSRSAQLELAPQKSYILRKTPSPNQLEESTARFSVLAALFSISEGRGRRGSKRKGTGMHLTFMLLISRGGTEDDLRSRIFGTFVAKFLACPPLLGFSNPPKLV